MAKEPVIHHDMLGEEIVVGSYAASFDSNSLKLFVIDKLNPKMVTVRRRNSTRTALRYPHDLIILKNEQVMLKLLKD